MIGFGNETATGASLAEQLAACIGATQLLNDANELAAFSTDIYRQGTLQNW